MPAMTTAELIAMAEEADLLLKTNAETLTPHELRQAIWDNSERPSCAYAEEVYVEDGKVYAVKADGFIERSVAIYDLLPRSEA